MIGIYKIINGLNGGLYIGSSVGINRRWVRHLYDLQNNKSNSIILQRAWNKYGGENFDFCIIKSFNYVDDFALRVIETKYIKKLKPKYNILKKAHRGPMHDRVFTLEHRKNISKGLMGREVKQETRDKISESQIGKEMPEDTRRKISNTLKGKYTGKKHPMWGKHISPEHKEKISNALKGQKISEEQKKKISESNRGEGNPFSKLITRDVLEIRKMYSTGNYSQKEISEIFDVSLANICSIVNKKTWKHL